jgi:hypothetical protein
MHKLCALLKSKKPIIVFMSVESNPFVIQGELFRDKNTNHILQFIPEVGLVHNESLCKEITGCIDFQKNN